MLTCNGRGRHFCGPMVRGTKRVRTVERYLSRGPNVPVCSIVMFFKDDRFGSVAYGTRGAFVVCPHSVQRIMSSVVVRPGTGFKGGCRVVGLFAGKMRGKGSSVVISSRVGSTTCCNHGAPRSACAVSFGSLFHFHNFSREEGF